jgi:exopolyphosphatase/guanosine-5'-triphosphate,3'-diphosphate pyrophosphatase
MKARASIDLGTNTCLLLIKEETPEGEKILHDESNVVRLGQGVGESGVLHPEAMERAKSCLFKYATVLKTFHIEAKEVIAVATAQARDAKNASEFFDDLKKNLGFEFKILTGDQESLATLIGSSSAEANANPLSTVVMDIGGGSTELAALHPQSKKIVGESINIGAVKLTEKFLKSDPVTDEEFWACEDAIDAALEKMLGWRKSLPAILGEEPKLVAVAGTAVTLAMLQLEAKTYDRAELDGYRLTRGDAHRLVEELKWRTVDERKKMPGMESKRADVILAGALIFWRVMEKLDFTEVHVSTRGLRYGVLKLF